MRSTCEFFFLGTMIMAFVVVIRIQWPDEHDECAETDANGGNCERDEIFVLHVEIPNARYFVLRL